MSEAETSVETSLVVEASLSASLSGTIALSSTGGAGSTENKQIYFPILVF